VRRYARPYRQFLNVCQFFWNVSHEAVYNPFRELTGKEG
jgi:hypothetical protein